MQVYVSWELTARLDWNSHRSECAKLKPWGQLGDFHPSFLCVFTKWSDDKQMDSDVSWVVVGIHSTTAFGGTGLREEVLSSVH